jgi:hypothetical protein
MVVKRSYRLVSRSSNFSYTVDVNVSFYLVFQCGSVKLGNLKNRFSGVNDTAATISAVSMTPLKSQTDFTSPFSSFKGNIQQKYFIGKYPHSIQVLEAEKSWGLPRPHFWSMTPLKSILATLEAIISANTMPYAKRF